MLPSIDYLKQQANLLVNHLGDKHRIRLKAAKALEAVAAIYRQPDWNTLSALAGRAAPSPASGTSRNPDKFPLSWAANGQPRLSVSTADWYRHSLASGGERTDRQKWLQSHFVEHLARGGAGVFLNAFNNLSSLEREALRNEQMLIDLTHEAANVSVNLMLDMSAEDIGHVTSLLAFSNNRSQPNDYWQHYVAREIPAVVNALRELQQPVTYTRMAELFPASGDTAPLLEVIFELDANSPAKSRFNAILGPHNVRGGSAFATTWAAHYRAISEALEELCRARWVSGLFSTNPKAQGLTTLLNQGKTVVIECPARAAGLPELSVMYAMRSALRLRYSAPWESRVTPWVFAMSEVDHYLCSALAGMAAQARVAKMAMLLTARGPERLKAHPVGRELLDDVWNTLHLQGLSEAQIEELLAQIADNPVLVQPSRITIPL